MTNNQPPTDGPILFCPQCREPAMPIPPRVWPPANGMPPSYSHPDGEPLCPVIGQDGYRPAEPIAIHRGTHDATVDIPPRGLFLFTEKGELITALNAVNVKDVTTGKQKFDFTTYAMTDLDMVKLRRAAPSTIKLIETRSR